MIYLWYILCNFTEILNWSHKIKNNGGTSHFDFKCWFKGYDDKKLKTIVDEYVQGQKIFEIDNPF